MLGLLLVIVLLFLFVPVRYRTIIKVQDDVKVDSCFSWLFHVVHARIRYEGKQVNYRLRIFGIPVKQNKEEADPVKAESKTYKRKNRKKDTLDKAKNKKKPDRTETKESESFNEPVRTSAAKTKEDLIEKSVSSDKEEEAFSQGDSTVKADSTVNRKTEINKARKGFHPIQDLNSFIKKLKETFKKFKRKIENVKSTIKNLLDKKNKIVHFIKDEGTKNTWKKTKKILFGWLRYIGPRKLKGYIRFGTGDPCQTGQILGVISIFYAKYHPKFSVYPDFEAKTLKADLVAHGRMSMIRFVRDGAGWYFDKEVKKCIAGIKQLKEEL